jgi:hypothetical protein
LSRRLCLSRDSRGFGSHGRGFFGNPPVPCGLFLCGSARLRFACSFFCSSSRVLLCENPCSFSLFFEPLSFFTRSFFRSGLRFSFCAATLFASSCFLALAEEQSTVATTLVPVAAIPAEPRKLGKRFLLLAYDAKAGLRR